LLAVSLSSNAESLKEKLHADNINSFDYDKMKTVNPHRESETALFNICEFPISLESQFRSDTMRVWM
jgi:hypothetical protein